MQIVWILNIKYKLIDIDECSESVMCSINANCLNTEGSFMCLCKDGFEGNGFVCEGKYIIYKKK